MKTATARELRNEFAKLMTWVREGESVQITLRGEEVALLVPKQNGRAPGKRFDLKAHRQWMKKVYGGKKLAGNSVLLMREGGKW